MAAASVCWALVGTVCKVNAFAYSVTFDDSHTHFCGFVGVCRVSLILVRQNWDRPCLKQESGVASMQLGKKWKVFDGGLAACIKNRSGSGIGV